LSLDVRRSDSALIVETDRLRLSVGLRDLALELATPAGDVCLAGAIPRAHTGSGTLVATGAVLDDWGEIRTRHGLGTRLQVRCSTASPAEMLLTLDVSEDWPGVALELRVEAPPAAATLVVDALEPLYWNDTAGTLALPGASNRLRFFHLGYQSESPCGFARLGPADPLQRLAATEASLFGPFTGKTRRSRRSSISDFATSLRVPGESGLTLGFLTHSHFLGWIGARGSRPGAAGGAVREITARNETESRTIGAREGRASIDSERLWIGLDSPTSDGLAEWAGRAGAEMGAPVPARVHAGWHTRAANASELAASLETIDDPALATPLDTVWIGPGYAPHTGDWLDASAAPTDDRAGAAELARCISERGSRPGIWLAPFVASRRSRVATDHPDWLLRDARGRPQLLRGFAEGDCQLLDPTHPGVLEWLRETAQALRGFGVRSFCLDQLWLGTVPGRRHTDVPSGAAYRGAIAAFREGAGDDALLLGLGAPLGPSIGALDAVRVCPAREHSGRRRLLDVVRGRSATPSATGLRSSLARAFLHQRTWLNDGPELSGNAAERRALVAVTALVGALPAFELGTVALRATADGDAALHALPASGRIAVTGSKLGAPAFAGLEVSEQLSAAFPDGSVWVTRVNLDSRPTRAVIDVAALGFGAEFRAYDVWEDRLTPPLRGPGLQTEPIPPGASKLFRLTPVDEQPRVVGSTLHLSGGAVETSHIRTEGERTRLVLRLPGHHAGRVDVARGATAPLSLEIEFRDALELDLAL